MNKVAEVTENSGLKALLAWCIFGSVDGPEMGNIAIEQINEFTREYRNAAGGRIKTMCGPHSPYVTSKHSLELIAATANELSVGCHIHVAETAEQMRRSKSERGMTPIRYLDSLGIFENPSIAAHAIYLDDQDIEILREKKVSVVSCPKTHMKLAMGTTRIVDLIKAGVNVALGTDGAASNNAMDMFEAAKLAALICKHDKGDASVLSASDALHLATRRGAVAMGFANSGSIETGCDADFILIDANKPHLVPRHNPVSNMVHAARPSDVSDVFVNGKQLLRKGELLTLDQEQIMREASARGLRMVQTGNTPVQTY
jgi:5-methylthioadenosine/S-adenosylhomocysteine deaminase